MGTLDDLLKGKSFGSLDEVNAFLHLQMQQRNIAPLDDFHGLSPEQMHRLLHFPFDTPALAEFPPQAGTPEAPILTLFTMLITAIGADGLKTTATGNLPRNFCREAARTYLGDEEYQRWSRHGELKSEPEFGELHVTRLVAELAGLIRKFKGKFILSKECRKLLAGEGASACYLRLFRAFVQKYNWAYEDHWGEIPFLQQSFLFSLYLLEKYGGDWRPNSFYEDCFLLAFPNLIPQVQTVANYYTPEQVVRLSYSTRVLDRFAVFMGLVILDRPKTDRYSEGFQVRRLPLFDQVVTFHN
jgi:hypothetical protein